MEYTLKQTTLNSFNLGLQDLNDTLNYVIKNKGIKQEIKKHIDIHEQSTQASLTEEQHLYNIPEFSEDLINNLNNEGNIIYNKDHKEDAYLNKALFYMPWTDNGRTVKLYAYGYKPTNYKHIKQLGNLYFGCSDWFVLFVI